MGKALLLLRERSIARENKKTYAIKRFLLKPESVTKTIVLSLESYSSIKHRNKYFQLLF